MGAGVAHLKEARAHGVDPATEAGEAGQMGVDRGSFQLACLVRPSLGVGFRGVEGEQPGINIDLETGRETLVVVVAQVPGPEALQVQVDIVAPGCPAHLAHSQTEVDAAPGGQALIQLGQRRFLLLCNNVAEIHELLGGRVCAHTEKHASLAWSGCCTEGRFSATTRSYAVHQKSTALAAVLPGKQKYLRLLEMLEQEKNTCFTTQNDPKMAI
jgi:hypothetical protein